MVSMSEAKIALRAQELFMDCNAATLRQLGINCQSNNETHHIGVVIEDAAKAITGWRKLGHYSAIGCGRMCTFINWLVGALPDPDAVFALRSSPAYPDIGDIARRLH